MKKSPFSRTAAHIFVSPGDTPGAITLSVVWMERIRYLQIVSQHVPIYLQQFSSYLNCKCKKSPFSRSAAHIFVSPGDAPATITQYVAWMERHFNACQTPSSMYLSIHIRLDSLLFCVLLAVSTRCLVNEDVHMQQFPSYTMLKSMRKSKNRYFYPIFVSPGQSC